MKCLSARVYRCGAGCVGIGFGVWSLGFGVQGVGLGVWVSGLCLESGVSDFEFRFTDSGFWVSGVDCGL